MPQQSLHPDITSDHSQYLSHPLGMPCVHIFTRNITSSREYVSVPPLHFEYARLEAAHCCCKSSGGPWALHLRFVSLTSIVLEAMHEKHLEQQLRTAFYLSLQK